MEMGKIQLTPVQVLEYIILGIKSGSYETAIAIAEDCIKQIKEQDLVLKEGDDG